MAAIEKVCEFSGDYPGHLMYGYKRASIQVCPQYRKEFANQRHVLIVFKPELQYASRGRWPLIYDANRVDEVKHITGYGLCIDPGYGRFWIPVYKSNEFFYMLYMPDVPGQVEGKYVNWSRKLGNVRRRLKRLLKAPKLNVFRPNLTWDEYSNLGQEDKQFLLTETFRGFYPND